MTTARLRAVVAAGASTMTGARLWPNGLGFDRKGAAYTFSEQDGLWWVRTPDRLGSGATPTDAWYARRALPEGTF